MRLIPSHQSQYGRSEPRDNGPRKRSGEVNDQLSTERERSGGHRTMSPNRPASHRSEGVFNRGRLNSTFSSGKRCQPQFVCSVVKDTRQKSVRRSRRLMRVWIAYISKVVALSVWSLVQLSAESR